MDEAEEVIQEVREVRNYIETMKGGKAGEGADKIPAEAWNSLGEMAVIWLKALYNRMLVGERMPEEWRTSTLVLIFKDKGDVSICSN